MTLDIVLPYPTLGDGRVQIDMSTRLALDELQELAPELAADHSTGTAACEGVSPTGGDGLKSGNQTRSSSSTDSADIRTDVSSRLRSMIRSIKYSDISETTGISRQHVSRVLRGWSSPTLEVASKLAQAIGVEVEELREYLGQLPKPEYKGKISNKVVEQIRELGDLSCREVQDRFQLSRQTVSDIRRSL